MANLVTNRIRLIGNRAIADLAKEINRRFAIDYERNNSEIDSTIVGRVLYGYEDDRALLTNQIAAKWVYVNALLEDWEPLRLVSGNWPVKEIQNHILLHASKIDPKVIVYMEYDDEMPNFVGARYVLFDNKKIQSFEAEFDFSHCNVVDDDELEGAIEENSEMKEFEKVINWDGVWELLGEQQLISFKAMTSKYSWAKDDSLRIDL
jgi:hypothetical protein